LRTTLTTRRAGYREGMFVRTLKYLGIAAIGSVAAGAVLGLVRILTESRDTPSDRARVLAQAISEGLNTSAFLLLVGAPIAVLVAYRRQRAR
jgi:hypothetical protein